MVHSSLGITSLYFGTPSSSNQSIRLWMFFEEFTPTANRAAYKIMAILHHPPPHDLHTRSALRCFLR
jgi:hypothetical protein